MFVFSEIFLCSDRGVPQESIILQVSFNLLFHFKLNNGAYYIAGFISHFCTYRKNSVSDEKELKLKDKKSQKDKEKEKEKEKEQKEKEKEKKEQKEKKKEQKDKKELKEREKEKKEQKEREKKENEIKKKFKVWQYSDGGFCFTLDNILARF